jgi:hypothetical protein
MAWLSPSRVIDIRFTRQATQLSGRSGGTTSALLSILVDTTFLTAPQ